MPNSDEPNDSCNTFFCQFVEQVSSFVYSILEVSFYSELIMQLVKIIRKALFL
jgi:hypothetical protein